MSHPEANKNPERVAAGLKAAMHNPNVSQDAKDHAAGHLRELEGEMNKAESEAAEERTLHETRVMAGYKAALKNPRVSDAAKQHAEDYLKEHQA
ncbi:hypothetical protein BDN72DRAFT_842826 [Pluteus cervinus]|uniref:Uncharacterized protein n=1 Tax=Pluteus cervinus TaxID=181527 RepID=A0ACD3AQ47_9AGAR|nr:hypothetical protein BDN72DRAFT_842826 [Pluteus cervinus]